MNRDEEIRTALLKHADEVRALATEYGGRTPQEQEAYPRNQLQYDLVSASNVIRKSAKKLAVGVEMTPEDEVQKLRQRLKIKEERNKPCHCGSGKPMKKCCL